MVNNCLFQQNVSSILPSDLFSSNRKNINFTFFESEPRPAVVIPHQKQAQTSVQSKFIAFLILFQMKANCAKKFLNIKFYLSYSVLFLSKAKFKTQFQLQPDSQTIDLNKFIAVGIMLPAN